MTNEMVKFTPGKVGTMSEETAKRLAAAYNPNDSSEGGEAVPKLKINYDSDSKTAQPGEWVVGQTKKDGEITEEGDRALGFIPIVVRNSFSMYDEKDTSRNCNSPVFKDWDEVVRGGTHKQICGKKTCSFAGAGECKAQKVAYGMALTQSKGFVDCMAYFSGVGYMPFADYIASTTKASIGGKLKKIPPFSYIASLGSEKQKKGSVTFYTPVLEKGGELSKDEDINSLVKKRDEIYLMIDQKTAEFAERQKENGGGGKEAEHETGSVTMADLMKASNDSVIDISKSATVEEKEQVKEKEQDDNAVADLLKAAGGDNSPDETSGAMDISAEIERALAGG